MSDAKKCILVPIVSKWVVEKGKWDNGKTTYVDRTFDEFTRTIEMKIETRKDGLVLVFIGGPTGHESYYARDLALTGKKGDTFCICGGTINSWPACYVSSYEVSNFINAWSLCN